MTHNSVEPEQGGLAHSATPKAQSNQVVELKLALTEAIIALADMYDQYCGDNFGHDFMGAGENAIEILEKYGLGDERKGVDQVALEKFERQHRVTDLAASNSEPTQTHTKSAQSAPQPNTEQLERLDLPAAIERALWAAYFDGQKEAKRLGGSNRVVLKEKAHLEQIIKAHSEAWNKANVIQAQQQLIERVKLHRDNPNWTAKAQRIANEQIDYIVSDLADRIAELNKEGETNGNHQEV